MSKSQFQSCPFSIMPKENALGMDGMNEIFMSSPYLANHARNTGTDWEWMGMDDFSGPTITEKSFTGADLFDMAAPTNETIDSQKPTPQVAVLNARKAHPAVVWCEPMAMCSYR